MTASVAMCTYNGAPYIEEQLLSILHQSVPVDEIVICDDGSTDGTIEIIKRIKRNTVIPISIHINERCLGVNANFEQAMTACTGDIILLSDQDDIWLENKVAIIKKYFEKNKEKQVVFGNAWLIDENGKCLSCRSLLEISGFNTKNQALFSKYAWEMWCQQNRATGATMAVRSRFIQGMSMTTGNIRYHDTVLAIEALKYNALGYLMEPLTLYRRHKRQTGGDFNYDEIYNANIFVPAVPHFDFATRGVSKKVLQRVDFMNQRCKFLYEWWGIDAISNMQKYWKYYGKLWYHFIAYDIRASINYSINRSKRKVFQIINNVYQELR